MYIFDIDGTLADSSHRRELILNSDGKYDFNNLNGDNWKEYYSLCHLDKPITPIIDIARALWRLMHKVIILTGRSESCRPQTEEWLNRFHIEYQGLIMRPLGDEQVADTVLKLNLLKANFSSHQLQNIATIFEDQDDLVKMFRGQGWHVCQVADYG